MSDKPETAEARNRGASGHLLVRDGHVMRNLVRSMVINMETVLNDLQGIMGDIQSLVVQIDSVTDKIDKHCRVEGSSSQMSQHCVKKPQCVHGSQPYSDSVHNPLYGQSDADTYQIPCPSIAIGMKNFEPIRAFRRDQRSGFSSSKQQSHSRPLSSEIIPVAEKNRLTDSRIPCPSKSFSFFPKDGGGIVSPSGSIAIVHPTVLCKPMVKHSLSANESSVMKASIPQQDDGYLKVIMQEAICRDPTKLRESAVKAHLNQQVFLASPLSKSASTQGKQILSKHRHAITSVYNKHFQPVTPTEQRSPISQNSSHIVKQVPFKHARNRQEESTLSLLPYHKYSTVDGGSLPSSPRVRRPVLSLSQESSNPRLNRGSGKPYYHQIDSSLTSSKSIRKPGAHHYYYSIESDLDSICEYPDMRSMTPDIDWSYLNLVGNRHSHGSFPSRLPVISSDNAYEIPLAPGRVSQQFELLQSSPDVVSRLPIFRADSSFPSQIYPRPSSSVGFRELAFMNKVYNSPVVTHIFCEEVNAFESGEYCGCYEAVVDSVLENIAGFESFDEACAHLDNDEIINESYVAFDNEFEEDDWDLGMRHEDPEDFDLPSFIIHETDDSDESLFGSLELLDDNQNLFETPDTTGLTQVRLASLGNHDKIPPSFLGTSEDMSGQKGSKRRLSPSVTDEDMEFPGVGGNSFTDDDCCALKPNVSGQHQNFTLWPKPVICCDTVHKPAKGKYNVDLESQMTLSSSDASSCQAVGSGSPMSFSSPEAAFTSPDTDRFVTSSEGDDLLTSQEEAYFLSSEAYDNAGVSSRKMNVSQLKREFFESLYTVCDRHEKEKAQNMAEARRARQEDNVNVEQSFLRVDNNKDNLSETGSYHEDLTSYNKNVNTWTAFAMVHVQADDVSDSASDIMNDNSVSHSMTSSYIDADNIGTAPGSQALTY